MGKQSDVLQSIFAKHADIDCCFTMVGRTSSVSFQEESKDKVGAILKAIEELLNSTGMKVCLRLLFA